MWDEGPAAPRSHSPHCPLEEGRALCISQSSHTCAAAEPEDRACHVTGDLPEQNIGPLPMGHSPGLWRHIAGDWGTPSPAPVSACHPADTRAPQSADHSGPGNWQGPQCLQRLSMDPVPQQLGPCSPSLTPSPWPAARLATKPADWACHAPGA